MVNCNEKTRKNSFFCINWLKLLRIYGIIIVVVAIKKECERIF